LGLGEGLGVAPGSGLPLGEGKAAFSGPRQTYAPPLTAASFTGPRQTYAPPLTAASFTGPRQTYAPPWTAASFTGPRQTYASAAGEGFGATHL
jgi:hypothetical protein